MKRASTPTDHAPRPSKQARVEEGESAVQLDTIEIPREYQNASIVEYKYDCILVNWDGASKVSMVTRSVAGRWTIAPYPKFTTTCNELCSVKGLRTPEEIAATKGCEPDEFVCVRAPQVNGPSDGDIQGRAAHSIVGGLKAMPSLAHGCIFTLDSKTNLPLGAVYVVYDDDVCKPLEVAVLEGGAAVVYLVDTQHENAHVLHIDSLYRPRKVTPIVFKDKNGEEDWPEMDGHTVPGPSGIFHIVSKTGVWRVGTMNQDGVPELLCKAELKGEVISVSACPLGVFVLLQSGLRFYPGAHREDLHHYTTIGYQPFEGACGMYVVPNPDVKGSYRAFIDGECAFIDVVDFTVASWSNDPCQTLQPSAPQSPSFPQDLQSRLQDIYASDSFPYLLGDGL